MNVPTSILSSPQNIAVCVGQSGQFSVVATGANLTYQWKKNGSDLAGKTESILTLTGITTGDAGLYSVVVSGSCGASQVSGVGVLTVRNLLGITEQPQSQTVPVGGSATFSVGINGTAAYQWKYNSVNIVGATGATYTISSVQKSNEGLYSVVITGECGSVTSANAVLTVSTVSMPVLTLEKSILNFTARIGRSTTGTFTITNTGTAPLQVSSIAVEGAEKSKFSVNLTSCSLEPNASRLITVTFAPTVQGSHSAKLTMESNAGGTPVVTLSGLGLPSSLLRSPVVAGQTDIGKSLDTVVQLCNESGVDLTLDQAAFNGDIASFSFIGQTLPSQLPLLLKKDSCLRLSLKFMPKKVGINRMILTVATQYGADTISIEGIGIAPNGVFEGENSREIVAYPNPSGNRIFVTIPSEADVRIVNALGRQVAEIRQYHSGEAISVEHLPNGIYMILVEADGNLLRRLPIVIVR